jgi:hypothetical protein
MSNMFEEMKTHEAEIPKFLDSRKLFYEDISDGKFTERRAGRTDIS